MNLRDLKPVRRFMALGARTRRTVLVCAAAVAICLVLPFGVFAAWDALLLGGGRTRPQPEGVQPLSDAGRQNDTACILYNCAHLLGIDPARADVYEGWTEQPLDAAGLAQAKNRCRTVVARAEELGLVPGWQAEQIGRLLDDPGCALTAVTAPGGLTNYSLAYNDEPVSTPETAATPETVATPETAVTSGYCWLSVTLTADGTPLAFQWQDSSLPWNVETPAEALEEALTLMGMESFDDWQRLDWSDRLPDAGQCAYSPQAQLYVSVNFSGGLNITAASMTQQEFDGIYGEEDSQ